MAFSSTALNWYGLLMLVGIVVTAWIWGRFTRRAGAAPGEASGSDGGAAGHDGRLTIIYFCGLLGALTGAKLAFLLAEGWHYRNNWMTLVSGRSVTGALLGGYAAVEIAKKWLRYPRVTGDAFAIVAPIGLMLGRVGCLLEGCCPGIVCEEAHWWTAIDAAGAARWPAAAMELLFNAIFLLWVLAAARCDWARGNRFHVYLIAYGLFRFGHEFLRDDVRIGETLIGGYHLIALATAGFGWWRYVQRRREMQSAHTPVVVPTEVGTPGAPGQARTQITNTAAT